MGAVLHQKTVTKDYLTHKQVKNINIISQFYTENHHEAIISKEDWEKAKEMISVQRGRSPGGIRGFARKFFFPMIKSGNLKGFYIIDCRWTKAEREAFLKIIESVQNLSEERNN